MATREKGLKHASQQYIALALHVVLLWLPMLRRGQLLKAVKSFFELSVYNVKNNFYVDDWLTSVKNINQATKVIKEVNELLACDDCRLMKFSRNKPEIL